MPETIPGELLESINERFDRGDKRMASLEEGLRANTAITRRIDDNTREMVEAFAAMQGAMKVLGWIGKAARPLGWIAAAAAAGFSFWSAMKGHIK